MPACVIKVNKLVKQNPLCMIDFASYFGWYILDRPSQHGADLLSLLSKLLDENTKPGETENSPCALVLSLALQALEQLCKAEVHCMLAHLI